MDLVKFCCSILLNSSFLLLFCSSFPNLLYENFSLPCTYFTNPYFFETCLFLKYHFPLLAISRQEANPTQNSLLFRFLLSVASRPIKSPNLYPMKNARALRIILSLLRHTQFLYRNLSKTKLLSTSFIVSLHL